MIIGALVGATAVGKTRMGVAIARELNAEIISTDSRQIYAETAIGSSQPSKEDRGGIVHHLMGFLSPAQAYSVAAFCRDVHDLVQENPDQAFLLVGGTGLYLQALMLGLSPLPEIEPSLRVRLESIRQRRGLAFLHRWLAHVDPVIGSRLSPGDSQRILRGLEVYLQTGKLWSSFQGMRQGGMGSFPVAWMDRPREELYRRIDLRTHSMVRMGWIEETEHLIKNYAQDVPALQGLGYHHLIQVLEGKVPLDQAIPEIQQETRNYAKRQLTWFRNKSSAQYFLVSEGAEIAEISPFLTFFKSFRKIP